MHLRQSQSWVDEWHRLAGGASDMADRVAKGKPPSPESQQVHLFRRTASPCMWQAVVPDV